VLGRKGTGMAEVAGPAIYSTNQPSRDFTSSPTLALHPTLSQPILLHFWAESLASPRVPRLRDRKQGSVHEMSTPKEVIIRAGSLKETAISRQDAPTAVSTQGTGSIARYHRTMRSASPTAKTSPWSCQGCLRTLGIAQTSPAHFVLRGLCL
jgi:hypothetical protein